MNVLQVCVQGPLCATSDSSFLIHMLKAHLGLDREDCQHGVIDEFLCMVAGCALGTDVCHWMFLKKSTCFKVNKIPL